MRYQIGALILAAFIGCIVLNQREDEHQCPHKNFLIKHVCPGCLTEGDALDFSRLRGERLREQHHRQGRIRKVNLNTVIFGTPKFIEVEDRCVNENPVTAFKCTMRENSCRRMGDNCLVKHHFKTGHLFPEEIECE